MSRLNPRRWHAMLTRMLKSGVNPTNCEARDAVRHGFHETYVKDRLKELYAKWIISGIRPTTKNYLAIGYESCFLRKRAEQVMASGTMIHPYSLDNLVLSRVVSTLAKASEENEIYKMTAFDIYEANKHVLKPEALVDLIRHLEWRGLDSLIDILQQLEKTIYLKGNYWIAGCTSVTMFCVRNKLMSETFKLLEDFDKKLNNYMELRYLLMKVFYQIAETSDVTHLQFGLELLKKINEKKLVYPPRFILDFLLASCVTARDGRLAVSVWGEYKNQYRPYNIFTIMTMYKVLLASGKNEAGKQFLENIPIKETKELRVSQILGKILKKSQNDPL